MPARVKKSPAGRAAKRHIASTKPLPASAGGGYEPDAAEALARVMRLMGIPGKSGEETEVAKTIAAELRKAGAPAASIEYDDVHRRSPHGGQCGSLICKLPGTLRLPRRLLMAHLDTVPLCVGSQPVLRGSVVRSADKTTGLGADDRAGCAVVLTAAIEILRRKLPHPPLTFFWPVQEEVGLLGAHYAKLGLLGKPRLAFNFDGGSPEKLTIGATGAYRLTIDIRGLASHAGGAPERGISAVTIAGLAIADLAEHGWLGDIHRNGSHGTSNIGVIQGGAATNVVTQDVHVRAEARSHDPRFRLRIVEAIEKSFQRAARSVQNVEGAHGRVTIDSRLDYESFLLKPTEPCVVAAEAAVQAVGGTPLRAITNGGVDANWLTARGIPTVTMGCGQRDVHTVRERLEVPQFQQACRIALRLATATESIVDGTR